MAAPEDDPALFASPSTATESPEAVTGADVDTGICAPERTPPSPEVVEPDPAAGALDAGMLAAPLEPASPSTATESPEAVTGAETETGT